MTDKTNKNGTESVNNCIDNNDGQQKGYCGSKTIRKSVNTE